MESTSAGPSSDSSFLKQFYIPTYILVPGSEVVTSLDVPKCPVLVFVNSKSGGQLGGSLLTTYAFLLNENQVFDLGKEGPDAVLRRIYLNLAKLKADKDSYVNEYATQIQERLRIIVAGGDGTAGWLLGVVCDLKLSHSPPIATVPLGTGNNLPFAFGWGKKNPGTDRKSVLSFLKQVMEAKEMKIDNWHFLMRMKSPKEGSCDPIAPLELPHSLHAFHRTSSTDELNIEGHNTFRGGFWNYFSMGMDAQVSYAFHSERKLHPEKFKNQLVNQSTYAKLGCTQGWFLASLFHPPSRNIAHMTKVKIMKKYSNTWEDLPIPHSIRSIVCLNLPSFSGGLNPWGTPNINKRRDRDLTPPFVDDGLIEIVGFRDAWHGLVLLAPNGHGTRLAQAHRILFEFHKGVVDHTFMRIDGEPWKQPLPVDDDTVVVEISHLGRVNMLATHDCLSKVLPTPQLRASTIMGMVKVKKTPFSQLSSRNLGRRTHSRSQMRLIFLNSAKLQFNIISCDSCPLSKDVVLLKLQACTVVLWILVPKLALLYSYYSFVAVYFVLKRCTHGTSVVTCWFEKFVGFPVCTSTTVLSMY